MEISPPDNLAPLAAAPVASGLRSRSKSPTYDRVIASAVLEHPPTPPNSPPSTWWGRNVRQDRPWRTPSSPPSSTQSSPSASPRISPKPAAKKLVQSPQQKAAARNKAKAAEPDDGGDRGSLFRVPLRRNATTTTIPKEQTEGWERTRERVGQALSKIFPTTLLITHDVLEVGSEVLKYAPIPGLEIAGSLLLNIWDNVQAVDMNRLACLRLAERCANLLLSVLEEIHEAGNKVEKEMAKPIDTLVETFTQVRDFLLKQAHRPFLKRYLKRVEILTQIAICDTSLGDAMGMFSLSVQMRILKQVKETEARLIEDDTRALALLTALQLARAGAGSALGIAADAGQRTPRQAPATLAAAAHDVLPALRTIHATQDTLDRARDTADLRALMQDALAQSSDVEMLRVLQVGRAEMPEALKTLQRALERCSPAPPAPPGHTARGAPQPQRSATLASSDSSGTSSTSSGLARDTLDREFIEGGIDALRRMSKGGAMLPSWTITRYEVDRDVKIGMGFFSDVYRGTWRARTVAVKCLAAATPRGVFLREVNIWKALAHPHVLALYGASAATGAGPWFFVCPYERFGSLSGFLRRGDLLRFVHEVAKGMEYLHDRGVLHGDLKAANVLVDDRIHCLVSDFGQSEMKSEAYRISGTAPPHGTLRWQAPELMLGSTELTPEMDVYSYAICCVEILSMGRLPWPLMSDEAVRNFVLNPPTRFDSPALQELLRVCWDRDPAIRPPFSKIVKDAKALRKAAELPFGGFDDLPSPRTPDWREADNQARPSPDMHPFLCRRLHDTVSSSGTDAPEHVVYTSSSRASSIFTPSTKSSSVEDLSDCLLADLGGYESPMPADERIAEIRNERRYRLLLVHDFHPSLTLPLWDPIPIAVGSVGFMDKSCGRFVTLLNCFYPDKVGNGDSSLPSVYGYGRRGLDAIAGLLTFKRPGDGQVSQNVSRRYSFPLRTGHKTAYLCAETTMYRYIENLDAPKRWFKANVGSIMHQYGPIHQIQKEDLYLVIGTLDAPDYALFVSHNHRDGQAHFNVFSSPKASQPWGTFTTDAEPEQGGPSYHEPIHGTPLSASKVSASGGQWDTVLVARLRFKPDVLDPTSL
ncbi:hypothetical protein B0H10DRAFT_2169714 [Mycena sp. CBHHK59/15]|nr:hypothetical protein B0H10DRAFT_2169714 [Mycena sp. CBHHK59/15]